ncbi:gibberellin 2-beta-dioxygenase 8 [Impatiens glandulifera]|uniref:gibberellin 2-beta-dioxygenase 8 n=1 Tax=Impatiens glandulifera TaxID=253017 RepID=UPI001FB0ED70|nr:gibberellin 2-beta-dioxygenase 8 [Impatiens glandulifera]
MENSSENLSYPPIFRPSDVHHRGVETHGLMGPEASGPNHDIPAIDLENLIDQENLEEACRNWGIFRAINHGIPETLFGQLLEHAKKVFLLDFETKRDLFKSPVTYFWGSPALTQEGETINEGNIDWVEGFNFPLSQLFHLPIEQDPNIRTFRVLLEEYGMHQSRLAKTIFQAMAKNLNLSPMQVNDYLSLKTGFIRVYRYPQYYSDSSKIWGMNPHTDSSVLSIIGHDDVGGLQIKKDHSWLDVKSKCESLVVNVGDMMQAMSNDKYKSVRHGVRVNNKKERISIGYFVFPAEECVIKSDIYRPFTYSDFHKQVQEDLLTKGFKVGLQNFLLTKAP